jgi:hypothetical protein
MNRPRFARLFSSGLLHIPPSDRAVTLLLALATAVAAARLPVVGASLVPLLVLHALLLGGFLLGAVLMARHERAEWVALVRPALTVTVIFTLYSSLGRLGIVAMPYEADAALSRLDCSLCGFDPSLALEGWLTPGRVEFLSFVYAAFIPYIYVTITLSCLGRPPLERDQFLTGWVFTYFVSYLGYLFVPARGPVFFHAADYQAPLPGGYFHDLVVRGVEATGGLQGVFPSLHVGGSLYLCLFELRVNRLRGLIYLPLVVLIYVATLVLRYHYVVDLIAGTVIAVGCLPLGRAAFLGWARRRQAACLPALPGGEGDALPAAAPAGAAEPEAVLSAD